MLQTYDVCRDGLVATLTAEQIEASYQLDADELAWAIEEYGRCDIDDDEGRLVTFVEHGDAAPGHKIPEDQDQVPLFTPDGSNRACQ